MKPKDVKIGSVWVDRDVVPDRYLEWDEEWGKVIVKECSSASQTGHRRGYWVYSITGKVGVICLDDLLAKYVQA